MKGWKILLALWIVGMFVMPSSIAMSPSINDDSKEIKNIFSMCIEKGIIPDIEELYKDNPAIDSDRDGLTDVYELKTGTSPFNEPWALFKIYIRALDSMGNIQEEKEVFKHVFDHFDNINLVDKTYMTSIFLGKDEPYSMGTKFYLETSITGVEGVYNNAWVCFYDGYGYIKIKNIKVVLEDE